MKRNAPRYLLALFALLALLLSACQTAETPEEDSTPDATSPTATGTATDTATTEPTAIVSDLKTADSPHGKILVTSDGRTVYLFTNDEGSTSNCNDQCAVRWPPERQSGDVRGTEGADSELIGQTSRSDGSSQVTYNGRPIYFFSEDTAPGDTKGQGVGGVWFVISPQGEAIRS